MENNNIEELNQSIEEVTEVTEENVNEVEESTNETEETTEENTEEVSETVEQIEENTTNVEESTEEVIKNIDEAIVESNKLEIDENNNRNISQATIIGYTKLNVRKNPSKDSEVVCIITKDSSITVDYNESTEDFYKVYVNVDNVPYEGFCMKEFISIK